MKIYRWLLCYCLPMVVWASPPTPQTHQLANGLTVLVQVDRRAPVVVSQIWYNVGSRHETPGITGVSHALEHMMFQGTDDLSPNQFSELIARNGGSDNAFTSRDYTAYFQSLASDRLELSLMLEADRMVGLRLDPKRWQSEQQVILEERRLRVDDSPTAKAAETFQMVAFNANSYRQPIIGWQQDIENLTLSDLQTWYQRWYRPANATLVIVGDVDPQQVFKRAEQYFGVIPPQPATVSKPPIVLPQQGQRQLAMNIPARLPYLLMGWQVPSLATVQGTDQDWKPYALVMLAQILDGGGSSRFSRELVRQQQLAASASASYGLLAAQQTLFQIAAYPNQSVSLDQLQQAISQQIQQLQTKPVSRDELQRALAGLRANEIYQRDSLFYQAMRLGIPQATGLGWQVLDDYLDRLAQVTPAQIRQAAQTLLTPQGLTVGHLNPTNTNTNTNTNQGQP